MPETHSTPLAAEQGSDGADDLILTEHVAEIRRLNKSALVDFIEVGRRLSKCRALLKGEGRWRAWLEAEFAWDRKTASNFIHLFELSESRGERVLPPNLPLRSLYLLAAPTTPESARNAVLDLAANGENLTHAEVKQLVAYVKPPAASTTEMVAETAKITGYGDDVGLFERASRFIETVDGEEISRLQARIEELEAALRLRDIKIIELETKGQELEQQALRPIGDEPLVVYMERLRRIIAAENQPTWLESLGSRKRRLAVKVFEQLHSSLGQLHDLLPDAAKATPRAKARRPNVRSKDFKLEVVGGTESALPH